MTNHPSNKPKNFGPTFEGLNEERVALVSMLLERVGISIPREAISDYLTEIDPKTIDGVSAFEPITELAVAEESGEAGQRKRDFLFLLHMPDEDSDASVDMDLCNEGDAHNNEIATLRSFYLLAHVVGKKPLDEIVKNIELQLAKHIGRILGRSSGNDLPAAWTSAVTRNKLGQLMKEGDLELRETVYAEQTKSCVPEGFDSSGEIRWVEALYHNDDEITQFVINNPDPKAFVDKLLYLKQLKLLSEMGAKKPLS